MICPQCKSEYQPAITQCADCDVALVPGELAPLAPEEQGSMATAVAAVVTTILFLGAIAVRIIYPTVPYVSTGLFFGALAAGGLTFLGRRS